MVISFRDRNEADLYREDLGRGFVGEAGTFPKRKVDTGRIQCRPEGVYIQENVNTMGYRNENDYNYGGLVYRMRITRPGRYQIKVSTLSRPEVTNVSVSGMMGESLLQQEPWDSAGKVPRENIAHWEIAECRNGTQEYVWSYDFVCGEQFLDIEVEPRSGMEEKQEPGQTEVGLACIQTAFLECLHEEEKPTLFLLGDSTAKSYVFEDAPLSGWGQVLDRLFDQERIRVMNYSQGGRSLKSMYQEGRLNDILIKGRPGDFIMIQSGHNDEARDELKGIDCRFGRGNTEASFVEFLEKYFLPAIHARGMKAYLMSCTTRLNPDFYSRDMDFDSVPVCFGGFLHENPKAADFPGLMCRVGEQRKVPVIDLYRSSSAYVEQLGGNGAKAMYFTLEPGESPGKSNSGSLANGNPGGFCDVAHYKECFSKQFARLIVTEMSEKKLELAGYLTEEVKAALDGRGNACSTGESTSCEADKWYRDNNNSAFVYSETAPDVERGKGSYYRNQIEKMIQTGIMTKDKDGLFHPEEEITAGEFVKSLEIAWACKLDTGKFQSVNHMEDRLKVSGLVEILYWGYLSRFGRNEDGRWKKPGYMTDYNGVGLSPDAPGYDCNLVGELAVYYPLVPWEMIQDKENFPADVAPLAKEVYELGLLRSESGIVRGKMLNGYKMEPDRYVTRGKAAKYLYFIWILIKPILIESQEI